MQANRSWKPQPEANEILIGTVLIGLFVSATIASLALAEWLQHRADPRILRSLDGAPKNALIVILGCKPRQASGRLNQFFIGRVASAAAAYHHEPSREILCTGRIYTDTNNTNEALEFADALEVACIPHAQILIDANSNRTIDSIAHVARNFPDRPILFVTQAFHLPRTLFLARREKLDAWGLLARGPAPGFRSRFRERIAEARALIDTARSKTTNH
jgi:SanA protein